MEKGDNLGWLGPNRMPLLEEGSQGGHGEVNNSSREPLAGTEEQILHSRRPGREVLSEIEVLEAERGGDDVQIGQSVPHVNDVRVTQESLMELERQRAAEAELRFSSTILDLRAERDKAIRQFQDEAQRRAIQNKFSNTLLRHLDDMGKALDHNRQAAKQAKRQLVRMEAEAGSLRNDKRVLLESIIETGPWAVWDWVKKEILEQGLEPSEDLERRWLAWLAAAEDVMISSSVFPLPITDLASVELAKGCGDDQSVVAEHLHLANCKEENYRVSDTDGVAKTSLSSTVLSIVVQEAKVNLQYVFKKGLIFLPMAWFCFWLRLGSRIAWHIVGGISSSLKQSPYPFGFHII